MYRDELISSLNNDKQTIQSHKKKEREENQIINQVEIEDTDTNWTQLLLGKLK